MRLSADAGKPLPSPQCNGFTKDSPNQALNDDKGFTHTGLLPVQRQQPVQHSLAHQRSKAASDDAAVVPDDFCLQSR